MSHTVIDKKEYLASYRKDIMINATSIIESGIVDPKKWRAYCNKIRVGSNYDYPDDFTDGMMFDLMRKNCYYCGSVALTIDRIDSSIGHILENCVGCCKGCNYSKGNSDVDTFLRKSYFRVFKKYIDEEIDIWSDNIHKPRFDNFEKKAKKQGVEFSLTKEQWELLTRGDCEYCCRPLPITKWNGVDRITPGDGYTPGNTVSCCDDCNVDKWLFSVEDTKIRNQKIATRLLNEEIGITGCNKILRNKGTSMFSKKVCVHGEVYQTKSEASRAIGMNFQYVGQCIRLGRHPGDIFEISDDFYNYITENKFGKTNKKMYKLFERM